jgi:hypothetical protein
MMDNSTSITPIEHLQQSTNMPINNNNNMMDFGGSTAKATTNNNSHHHSHQNNLSRNGPINSINCHPILPI